MPRAMWAGLVWIAAAARASGSGFHEAPLAGGRFDATFTVSSSDPCHLFAALVEGAGQVVGGSGCLAVCTRTDMLSRNCSIQRPAEGTGNVSAAGQLLKRAAGGELNRQCQEPGTSYCKPGAGRSTTFTVSTPNLREPPAFSMVLLSDCGDGTGIKARRFGFALQLYGPSNPFAIGRHFCPGADALLSDKSCCVLNLCNGRFGESGQCKTPCGGITVTLEWHVSWK